MTAESLVKARAARAAKRAAAEPKDPATMTPEERRAEHERLTAALAAIPYVAAAPKGVKPGTVIGEGLTREYAPHDSAWFLDVEERRKDRNLHNGVPAELTWPNYQMHDVVYQGVKPYEEITINGVGFAVLPGQVCQLPTPHFGIYMQRIAQLRKHEKTFAPPSNPSRNAGYVHANYNDMGRMVAVLLGKGPLDKSE